MDYFYNNDDGRYYWAVDRDKDPESYEVKKECLLLFAAEFPNIQKVQEGRIFDDCFNVVMNLGG